MLQGLTLLDRGYTGHEHLQTVGLIHMNGRLYDPALHRFLQPDNYVQDPFNTQNFNRYGYCLNNPLVYVDENGEFIITVLIVGAIIGAYIGGSQANGTYNPFKWDFNNVDTWIGMVGGATGALTTPKGHNIWTGREIQPVQTLEGAPINIHLDAENNITGNLELNTPTTNSVLDLQQPKLIPIETPDGGIRLLRMGNTDINSLQGEVRNNFKRFISKIPANSKTNATWRVLDDGNYLFQTISPGKVPGSTALYQKIVSPQGETLKMIKTTFSPQGDIIHVKSKL